MKLFVNFLNALKSRWRVSRRPTASSEPDNQFAADRSHGWDLDLPAEIDTPEINDALCRSEWGGMECDPLTELYMHFNR